MSTPTRSVLEHRLAQARSLEQWTRRRGWDALADLYRVLGDGIEQLLETSATARGSPMT